MAVINGQRVLEIYPGQQKYVQLLNLDGQTAFNIPAGSTVQGSLVTQLSAKIDTLSPIVSDNVNGLIRIVLAANNDVKANYDNLCFFNIQVTAPNMLPKNMGTMPLQIMNDLLGAVAPQAVSNFGTGTALPGGNVGGAATNPVTLVILDQTWQSSTTGKKFVNTIVETGGTPTFQLQEVT